MTTKDIALLKLLFGQGHPSAVKTHMHLLNRLMLPFRIAEQFKTAHIAI